MGIAEDRTSARSRRRTLVRVLRATVTMALLAATAAGQNSVADGPGNFGRIFHLPPFAPPSPEITASLLELGKRGGLMDARDEIDAGPIALIVDPNLSKNNKDNDQHTAGTTFLGQFFDHDMTFDATSRLGTPTNPRSVSNVRSPHFDLDSVYGDGPAGSPLLYDTVDRAKFRLESNGAFEDLPRDGFGRAIIADPRNDENLIIAGLQIAFLLFHNHAVDLVRASYPAWPVDDIFREARQLTTWHYQWLILYEMLPLFVGAPMVDSVRAAPQLYTPAAGRAVIPVDFQIVYRFGHSMVRPSYRANFTGDDGGAPFFAMLFDSGQAPGEPGDLRGGVRSPRRFVGWQTFFLFPGFDDDVRHNKLIDTKLSTPLFDLPLGAIASGTPPTSLAQRNLLRHLTWRIPSGQSIAAALGAPILTETDFPELWSINPHLAKSTPLWYYVLKEAELLEGGHQLGPVGGRIVAEVFVALLRSDPEGFLTKQPEFLPSLGRVPGQFSMIDFLTFAGVAAKR